MLLFDRFLLAVESHDLSQADKILIREYFFPELNLFSVVQQLKHDLCKMNEFQMDRQNFSNLVEKKCLKKFNL